MEIGERISMVRKDAGLTMEKFGERIGIKKSSVSTLESGKTRPSEQTIKFICEAFHVNEIWLRTGAGEMHEETREQEMGRLVKQHLGNRPESFQRELIATLLRFDPNGKEWAILEEILARVIAEYQEQKKDPPENSDGPADSAE